MRQILINIIGNAVKFTKDGTVTVNIMRKQKNDNNGISLRFEVSDTGIGIPPEKIDSIFNKFTQVDSSTTREYDGTGLGLTISKTLVEMMNGKIGVESQLGIGSTFWFEIDFKVPENQFSFTQTHDEILKKKKILLVDDYSAVNELVNEYFLTTGAICDHAESASDALEKIMTANMSSKPYDVVLTDYSMPKMDGETMCVKITEHPELYGNPRRILITALAKKRNFQNLSKAGISAYLFKPVYPESLIECVSSVLLNNNDNNLGQAESHYNPDQLPQIQAHALVVDDDRVSQRMIKSILTEIGCTFDTASDGKEALQTLEDSHNSYDIVFMDWQMPIMDGHEAIRLIRQQEWGKSLKIMALTANAIQGDKEKCLDIGADDYISKPVRVSDVINVMNKHLPDLPRTSPEYFKQQTHNIANT